MAQRVHPISFRLGFNYFWNSLWYTNKHYSALFFEDQLLKHYLKNLFENRGFFLKRVLIKRSARRTLIFLEVYGNPYFKYAIPRDFRQFQKFKRVLHLTNIKKLLNRISGGPVFLSVQNLFIMNRIHRNFLRRLRGQFFRYKNYKFTLTILGIFNIVIRTKGAAFLAKAVCRELEFIERRKKNKIVWRFVSFIGKLVSCIQNYNKTVHGLRVQLKGRFRGISRPKTVRFREGCVPFNTIRAFIDFAYAPALTVNGTFGIKVWVCYI